MSACGAGVAPAPCGGLSAGRQPRGRRPGGGGAGKGARLDARKSYPASGVAGWTQYDLEAAPQRGKGFREPGRHRSLVAGHKPEGRARRQRGEQARHPLLALEAHHRAPHDAGVQELHHHSRCEVFEPSHLMIVNDDRRLRQIPLDDGPAPRDGRPPPW